MKKKKRKYSPKEVAGMQLNRFMRMSPHELRAELERNERLPEAPLDYELELDADTLDEDECPAFDDMDGDD